MIRSPRVSRTIRLPPALAAALKAAADRDGRSVNNYLIRLIERAVGTPER